MIKELLIESINCIEKFEGVGDTMTEDQLEKVSNRVATLREAII